MLTETVLDWKRQWLDEGKAEGMAQGKAEALIRLLARRFGPLPDWVAQRAEGASGEESHRPSNDFRHRLS